MKYAITLFLPLVFGCASSRDAAVDSGAVAAAQTFDMKDFNKSAEEPSVNLAAQGGPTAKPVSRNEVIESEYVWQYKIASLQHDLSGRRIRPDQGQRGRYAGIQAALNEYGQAGWELLSATGDMFIFKRAVPAW